MYHINKYIYGWNKHLHVVKIGFNMKVCDSFSYTEQQDSSFLQCDHVNKALAVLPCGTVCGDVHVGSYFTVS